MRPRGIQQPDPSEMSIHFPSHSLDVLPSWSNVLSLGLGLFMCFSLPGMLFSLLFPWLTHPHLLCPMFKMRCLQSLPQLFRQGQGLCSRVLEMSVLPFTHNHHACHFLCGTCLPCHIVSSTRTGQVGGLVFHTIFRLGKSSSISPQAPGCPELTS